MVFQNANALFNFAFKGTIQDDTFFYATCLADDKRSF
jgi:hypothetical protein